MWNLGNKKVISEEEFNSVEELVKLLRKHRYWGKINESTLLTIFNQLYQRSKEIPFSRKISSIEMQGIREFLFISEQYDLVKSFFIEIAQNQNEKYTSLGILSMFAFVLQRSAETIAEGFPYSDLSERDNKIKLIAAELLYRASILCDKYCLVSYYGVVFCCSVVKDLEMATEWRRNFYKIIEDLKNEDSSDLNEYQRVVIKEDKDLIEEVSVSIDQLYASLADSSLG